MGFLDKILGGGSDDDKAAKDAAEADIARIEAGGIPLAAEQRIRELAQGGSAFTSNMSVTDFALSKLDGDPPDLPGDGQLDLQGRLAELPVGQLLGRRRGHRAASRCPTPGTTPARSRSGGSSRRRRSPAATR